MCDWFYEYCDVWVFCEGMRGVFYRIILCNSCNGGGSDKNYFWGVMWVLIWKVGKCLLISCDKIIIYVLRLVELIIFLYNDRNEMLF